MKKLLLTLTLFAYSFLANAQLTPVKLRSSHFAQKHTNSDGYWTNFSDWASSDILILAEQNRVTVFSEIKQVYDVIEQTSETVKDNTKTITYDCLDENGSRCHMSFTHVYKNGVVDESYLYFSFSNLVLMYKIYKLD